jgi:hypothetical protein
VSWKLTTSFSSLSPDSKFKGQIIQANIRSSPFGVVLICASSTVLLLNLCCFPTAVYSLSRMTIVLFELLDDKSYYI